MKRKFHIALAFDNLQNYSITLINNIVDLSDKKIIIFHLFISEKTQFEEHILWLKKNKVKFKIYIMKKSDIYFKSVNNKTARLTDASLYRLLIANRLDKNIQWFLYMDIDIYINMDIIELFDFADEKFTIISSALDLNEFNSGLLLINRSRYISKLCPKILESILVSQNYPDDQNILFNYFKEEIKIIPIVYNLPIEYYVTNELKYKLEGISIENAKIIHFMGTLKPWRYSTNLPFKKEWLTNYKRVFGEFPWKSKVTFKEIILKCLYMLFPNPAILFKFFLLIRVKILKNTPLNFKRKSN